MVQRAAVGFAVLAAVTVAVAPAACGGATTTEALRAHGDGGTDSDVGGCQGANPGCCGSVDGCNQILAGTAVCYDGDWTCPGTTIPPGVCDALCSGSAIPTLSSTSSSSPSSATGGGCSGGNPGCCMAEGPEQCHQLVDGTAVCSDGAWTCAEGVGGLGYPPGVCDALCTGSPTSTSSTSSSSTSTSSSNSSGCGGENPGCCMAVGPDRCNQIVDGTAVCSDGQWTCAKGGGGMGIPPGECDALCSGSTSGSTTTSTAGSSDAGALDSGGLDGGEEGIPCGNGAIVCDPATVFCLVIDGPPVYADGGTVSVQEQASCQAIPAPCLSMSSPAAQCGCTLSQLEGEGAFCGGCSESGGGFTIGEGGGVCCVPATCASLGATCGAQNDGCGGLLECGTCTSPETCGGGVCGG